MTVTFRPARTSDRATYDWKFYGIDRLRPTVVTINGKIALVVKGGGSNVHSPEPFTVLYQDGDDSHAELVRATRRVIAALERSDYRRYQRGRV